VSSGGPNKRCRQWRARGRGGRRYRCSRVAKWKDGHKLVWWVWCPRGGRALGWVEGT
jgi:hypothetical protein